MLEALKIPELKTEVVFLNSFENLEIDFGNCILLYDEHLEEISQVDEFLKNSKFHRKISLTAGESLKSLESLGALLADLAEACKELPVAKPTFVAMGGGSVGDFVGFAASIYQRGCPLVHIPSTWLAAIDSSHGGKTALNTDQAKNQLGTFHQAQQIFMIRELLFSQPKERLDDCLSEIIKVYMLIEDERKFFLGEDSSEGDIFKTLKHCVEQKYLWVKKDPEEKLGIRQALNLGHTMGHAFEKSKPEMSHGFAVAMGLCFCVRYSYAKKKIKDERYQRLLEIFTGFGWWEKYKTLLGEVSSESVMRFLIGDKKKTRAGHVNFIFLTDLGHKVEEASIEELVEFLKREIIHA